jgi:hypothetical protein
MRQILIETIPFDYQIVEARASGRMTVKGKVQHGGIKNANGRTYPLRLLEREVGKLVDSIGDRSIVGELDHPEDGKTKLHRVSHVWTELSLGRDGVVTGLAEILNTPRGAILQELYRAKVKVGASSRGQGSVNAKSGEVTDDFSLDTFDMVHRPSTPGAYTEMIREEIEEIDGLVKDEDKGHARISEIRRLVAEYGGSFGDLERTDLIELGARLMHGEFACRRLIGQPAHQGLAEETLSLAGDLRSRIEHELGIVCTEGVCCLAPATPNINTIARDAGSDDTRYARRTGNMDDLKALREQLDSLNKQIASNTDELSRLRQVDTKYQAALQLIDEMKHRMELARAEKAESDEARVATERLLTEAVTKIETQDLRQAEGHRRRGRMAVDLATAAVNRARQVIADSLADDDEEEEAENVYLEAASKLGDALIVKVQEEARRAEAAERRAAAAERLSASILSHVKQEQVTETLDGLLSKDSQADKIRPILEEMNLDTPDEMRAAYARLRSLRGRQTDTTLPPLDGRKRSLTESRRERVSDPNVARALDVAARLGGV